MLPNDRTFMRLKFQTLTLSFCIAATLPLGAQTNMVSIFANGDLSLSNNFLLVWPTTPGVRYEVFQSTNLQSWSTVPGYPATADGPVEQMPFSATGAAGYFQVGQLDEQPPAIVSRTPPSGSFAVSQFSDLTVQLSDVAGIDTNSIQLTIGNLGTFTLTNAQLTFSNGVLTFINDGLTPLGDYGTNVQVTLVAADTLGNVGTNTWTFTLEVQPQVATNLFVFGSSQAQIMGQRIGNIPTAALARRTGPIPAIPKTGGNPWTLTVESNSLVLAYTNTAPDFATNTYVCNLTPATTNDIFYRQIIAISNDPVNMLLTLFTTNVPLAQILPEGSASLSSNSVIYNFDAGGLIKPAISFNQTFTQPTLGADFSGDTIYDNGGVTLKLDEGYWLFTPTLWIAFETHNFQLQRFEGDFSGDMNAALVPELSFTEALQNDTTFDLFSQHYEVFLGTVGVVPVWVDVGFDLQAQLGYNLSATATMSTGIRQDLNVTCGVLYDRTASPIVSPVFVLNLPQPEIVPFAYSVNGSASAYVALVPKVSARVESLAGVEANVNPKVMVGGQATYSGGQLTSATWGITADAYLTLGLSIIGVDDSDLPTLASIQLFSRQWSSSYPQPAQLTIQNQPQSENVAVGSSASFSVDAVAGQPMSCQWYFNGVPMPGQTSQTLLISSAAYGDGGNYSVRVTAGGQAVNSTAATLTVSDLPGPAPSGMAIIPAGSFVMGDSLRDSGTNSDELPLHTVYVSAFYMDRYDVTLALWRQVYNWAIAHGYSFDGAGSGKAANHPVQTVDWYDCVKWCNARSEMEGRTPAYYTSAAQTTVYRTGDLDISNACVNWNGGGYRLPTESEWEKAARGGASGQRFPRGNTISWSQANYYAGPSVYTYDVNPTSGYDPAFNDGVYPFTSPVGYFAPNGYGLYDMAGNVWQWCWDWYGDYSSGSQTDPRGPFSSPFFSGCIAAVRGMTTRSTRGVPVAMSTTSIPSTASSTSVSGVC